jgi:hypothetical protein
MGRRGGNFIAARPAGHRHHPVRQHPGKKTFTKDLSLTTDEAAVELSGFQPAHNTMEGD